MLQGATIRRDDDTGAIIVARIMKGGAADRSGEIHVCVSVLLFFCLLPCVQHLYVNLWCAGHVLKKKDLY